MKHFQGCACPSCRRLRPQPQPPAPSGFLMRQIIGAGRAQLHCAAFALALSGLPCGARPPCHLIAVCADNEACGYTVTPGCPSGATAELLAHIPLCCTVRDGDCVQHTVKAVIDVPVCVRQGAGACRYVLSAQVRLCAPCVPLSACGCEAPLHVCLEAWAVTDKAVYAPSCAPACPPLPPLYPQPCAARCDIDRAPCAPIHPGPCRADARAFPRV